MVNNTFDKIMEEVVTKVSEDAENTYSEPHKAPSDTPLQEGKENEAKKQNKISGKKEENIDWETENVEMQYFSSLKGNNCGFSKLLISVNKPRLRYAMK